VLLIVIPKMELAVVVAIGVQVGGVLVERKDG